MSRLPPVRVLTLADDRYAMPLAVMGLSLLEHHSPHRPLHLKIIDGGLTAENRARVERSWRSACRGPVVWEWVTPVFGSAPELPVWGRIPVLTYARLFLDSYFEPPGRVLVIDSDTLVLGDAGELFDADLGGHAVGACVDPFIPTLSAIDGLPASVRQGLASDTPYFNAGVMVADLALWRQLRVEQRALEYIGREYRSLRQYDQDALNAVLAGSWQMLNSEWHVHPRAPNALGSELPANPRIVHFSGRLKPWLYDGGTGLDRLYIDYIERTAWRGFHLPDTWAARFWKLYDSPLRRLVHAAEAHALAWKRSVVLGLAPKPRGGSDRR